MVSEAAAPEPTVVPWRFEMLTRSVMCFVVAGIFAINSALSCAGAIVAPGKPAVGKDYTDDPAGALRSMENGTPGYMGGQLPGYGQGTSKENSATGAQREKSGEPSTK
jgi:hypothetical protein